MLVLLISKTIGDIFNHSVYDQIVHIKGLPFLEEPPEPYMKHLTAYDVCSSPVITLNAMETVDNVVDVLKRTSHNAFPVIDNDPTTKTPILYGLILRSHLLVLLKGRGFLSCETLENGGHNFFSSSDFAKPGSTLENGGHYFFSPSDFAKPGSGKGVTIDDIMLSEDELKMFMDLHPFTNTSPYTVVDSMSLNKTFTLFRHLGLRHLCVVQKIQHVSSLISWIF